MTSTRIEETYTDAFGRERSVDPEVKRAVLDAMGEVDERAGPRTVAVVPPGHDLRVSGELVLEDGTNLGQRQSVPPDAPFGYHRVLADDGEHMLITGPGRCHLPRGLREWGWAVQLATTRSSRSWGIGDLADLGELGAWTAGLGGGFLAVSPLGAPNPGPQPEPSPYYPSTRRFGNPLHVSVDAVGATTDVGDLAERGRAYNGERRIDRGPILAAKLEALERIWRDGVPDRDRFEGWRTTQGESLERWARFSVLSERLGPGWQSWPEEYRHPDRPSVVALARDASDRVAFHAWVQWCFSTQLEAASAPIRRIADMPVGVDPGGFDAWEWQDSMALGASVGAPPDRFNTAGQDWGLPPLAPDALRAASYSPFIDTIRAQLRHAGGLRIDHVLGLFRLWCIPRGEDAQRGAYVRYPTDELLEIVAIESHRAGAVIVGEDLGTVPPGVREELRRRRVLSTRLVLFEKAPPDRYPRGCFAAVTTHDLPTVAGIVTGEDLDDQREAGLDPDPEGFDELHRRLAAAAGVDEDAPLEELVPALHRRLAAAPPALVAATLEDALQVTERPNVPGTVAPARDNWSIALPVPIDDLADAPPVTALIDALRRT